jgi:hypothetical protein
MGAHELVAWLVLFCAPIEGYIQSKFSGAFTIRYALVMVLPFSLALALACDRLSRGSATAATAMLAICTFVGVRSLRQSVAEHPNPFVSFQHNLADRLPANQTLVVGTPLLFLPFHHYAPEPLRSRLLYLTDPELALQRSGTNTPDVNLEHLARFERIPIARYRSLIETRRPFLLLMKENDHFTWLGKQLVQDAIPLRKLACAPVVGCLYQAGTS